jgi:hypothetical protein
LLCNHTFCYAIIPFVLWKNTSLIHEWCTLRQVLLL